MSRTAEAEARKRAYRKGFLAGEYEEAQSTNPYRMGTDSGTALAWLEGWEVGRAAIKRRG